MKLPADMTNEELDAAIADEIMGASYFSRKGVALCRHGSSISIWPPTKNYHAVFKAVEQMATLGWIFLDISVDPRFVNKHFVRFREVFEDKDTWDALDVATLPRALCEAMITVKRNRWGL